MFSSRREEPSHLASVIRGEDGDIHKALINIEPESGSDLSFTPKSASSPHISLVHTDALHKHLAIPPPTHASAIRKPFPPHASKKEEKEENTIEMLWQRRIGNE